MSDFAAQPQNKDEERGEESDLRAEYFQKSAASFLEFGSSRVKPEMRSEMESVLRKPRDAEALAVIDKLIGQLGVRDQIHEHLTLSVDLFPAVKPLSDPQQLKEQLEAVGALYFISRLVDESPLSAMKLLEYLEGEEVSYDFIHSRVEGFYKGKIFTLDSVWSEALKREFENSAADYETHLLGGVLIGLFDLTQPGVTGWFKELGGKFFQSEASVEIRDLDDAKVTQNIERFLRGCIDLGDKNKLAQNKVEIDLLKRQVNANKDEISAALGQLKLSKVEFDREQLANKAIKAKEKQLQGEILALNQDKEKDKEKIRALQSELATLRARPPSNVRDRMETINSAIPKYDPHHGAKRESMVDRDFRWRIEDPAGYAKAQENWKERRLEIFFNGFELRLNQTEAMSVNKASVVPHSWYSRDGEAHVIKIPKNSVKLEDPGWGNAFIKFPDHKTISEYTECWPIFIEAIQNLKGERVERVPSL